LAEPDVLGAEAASFANKAASWSVDHVAGVALLDVGDAAGLVVTTATAAG
jgi:hypothetical protein